MYKKLIRLNAALLAACTLLAGCASGEEGIKGSVPSGEALGTVAGGDSAQGAGQGSSAAAGSAEKTDPAQDKTPRPKTEQKKLYLDMESRIKAVGGDKLLAYGSNLDGGDREVLLLDMYTLEILKRAGNEAYGDTFRLGGMWEEGSHYKLYGRLYDMENFQKRKPLVIIDYDSELRPTGVLDVDELLGVDREEGNFFSSNYEFYDSGQRLLYLNGTDHKLYLYDFRSGAHTEIAPQQSFTVYEFLHLEGLGQILLRGADENGREVLARMDMDGKILRTDPVSHYYGQMWELQDFVLIKESVPMQKEGECAVFKYNLQDGSVQVFPLAAGNKTADFSLEMNMNVSSGGKYYVAWHWLRDEGICYEPCIYSSEDGSLVRRLQLSSGELGESFMISGVYIDDEAERMVLYGSWSDKARQLETWILSMDLFE